jgi:cytochrome d ubiquinol oxidase subunit II
VIFVEASALTLFWAAVIAASILIYALLDGFDLGVGILFRLARRDDQRAMMMDTIAPYWDGNQTWLVMIGAGLYAAFPIVYAVVLGAMYIPVVLLLTGLIFRGIAFEFRHRTERMRWLWDWGFFLGSTLSAFVQGAAVGLLMRGIPVKDGQYAGLAFGWLHPFSIVTGIGMMLGYTLLGACWLVLKSEGNIRLWAYRRIPWLIAALVAVLIVAFALTFQYSVIARSNLEQRSWGLVFPAICALALVGVLYGVRKRRDGVPFAMSALFFLAAYATLGVMFWPFMVPYAVTVAQAAAPEASLSFLFVGGVVVLPVVVFYTLAIYWVFRGKVRVGYG